MNYMICSKVEDEIPITYRGMDRNGLIWKDVCDDDSIVEEVEAVCVGSSVKDEQVAIDLYKRIVKSGYTEFELLAVDQVQDIENWIFAGYDIGEKNHPERKWSAIFKYTHYTVYDKVEPYFKQLNKNGLFDSREAAERFRKFYLNKSGDEVLLNASTQENEELYQVAAVYLYKTRMGESGTDPQE